MNISRPGCTRSQGGCPRVAAGDDHDDDSDDNNDAILQNYGDGDAQLSLALGGLRKAGAVAVKVS